MSRITMTNDPARASRRRVRSARTTRDDLLIELTDRVALRRVIEATHGASAWGTAALNASRVNIRQGLALIEDERARLEDRLRSRRDQLEAIGSATARVAFEAEIERIYCRQAEIANHQTYLTSTFDRLHSEVEIETIEWQRPLLLADGSVAGYVDLWATVRATCHRIAHGADPWDPEGRQRYEGTSVHHLIRSIAIVVEPRIDLLSGLIRRVRFTLALAKNALPVVVTCDGSYSAILAAQGIPSYVWSRDAGIAVPVGALPMAALPAPTRRPRRGTTARSRVVPQIAQRQLPSPRPSLPPAPLS